MFGLLLAAALATTFAVVVGKSSKPKGDDGDGTEPKGDEHPSLEPKAVNAADVRQHAILVGAPLKWQEFFLLVAQGESGFRSDVGLGVQTDAPPWVDMNSSTAEAKAAERAYERNVETFAGCWPKAAYGFGSGGWYGMLPANGIIAFKNDTELKCLHPWVVFDPKISTIMAAWFARRLQGWKNWDGTVLSLRVGWGAPEKMGDADYLADKRSKFAQDCVKAGLPASFLDEKLPNWKPNPATELFNNLGGDRGWLPE